MAPRKDALQRGAAKKGYAAPQSEDDDMEYRKRRERNNEAVKKSRVKSKIRTQQTLERVQKLKTENEILEGKIKTLTKELEFLKQLFFTHTGTNPGSAMDPSRIDTLIKASTALDEKPAPVGRRTRRSREDGL